MNSWYTLYSTQAMSFSFATPNIPPAFLYTFPRHAAVSATQHEQLFGQRGPAFSCH